MRVFEHRISFPISFEEWKILTSKLSVYIGPNEDHVEVVRTGEHSREEIWHLYRAIEEDFPSWLRDFLTLRMFTHYEFPISETIITLNDIDPEIARIEIICKVVDDDGSSENALNLTEEELACRQIYNLDLVDDDFQYSFENDPTTFKSEKTGRGKLTPDWKTREGYPITTIYLSVALKFELFALEDFFEEEEMLEEIKVIKETFQSVIIEISRAIFCSMDDWYEEPSNQTDEPDKSEDHDYEKDEEGNLDTDKGRDEEEKQPNEHND